MAEYQSYDEEKLKEYVESGTHVEIEVNLKLGNDAFKCFTCDFTRSYIDINMIIEIKCDQI